MSFEQNTNYNMIRGAPLYEGIVTEYNSNHILSEQDKIIIDLANDIIYNKYIVYKKSHDFDQELWECLKYIHESPNKKKICNEWTYGIEFSVIDSRHCNNMSFYDINKGWTWEKSFYTDFICQLYMIVVPHRDINTMYLDLLHKINIKLRVTMNASMNGTPEYWISVLGNDLQSILNMEPIQRNECLSLWEYNDNFLFALKENDNKKHYFSDDMNVPWIYSFVTTFIMSIYH